MAFGTGAYYYIENGLGRDVSIEEALDVLRKGMAAGLVPQPGNGQRVWGICMCCSCGCQLLRALKKMEKPAQLAHTNFYATCEDENCTACGTCVERCPMAAIELEDTAMVNRDRCIGCGVCVAACEVDAMVLHAKQEKEQYVPPRDIVDMQKRIAQERRLLQE
jgi:ferredoxin